MRLLTKTVPHFKEEVMNLLYTGEGKIPNLCVHCSVCSATCPAVEFMDHSPRMLLAMINAGMKDEVLASNTFWTCSSCFACSERCPQGIQPAQIMYALKRYSLWHSRYKEGLIGPDFSRRFVKTILKNGKSYEPGYAPAFMWENGVPGAIREAARWAKPFFKGRLSLIPAKIKRVKQFRQMIGRIIPLDGVS
jgi:heterodisulfide reductase subunit C